MPGGRANGSTPVDSEHEVCVRSVRVAVLFEIAVVFVFVGCGGDSQTGEDAVGGPIIQNVSVQPSTLDRGGEAQVEVSATGPDSAELSYAWKAPSGWSFEDANAAKAILKAPDETDATATVEVTVSADGQEATATALVSTKPNRAPLVTSLFSRSNPVVRGGSTEVQAQAEDPDGDRLTYEWSLENDDWSYSGEGSTISLQAPDEPSSSTSVTVSVTDELGAERTASTQVGTVSNRAPQITSVPPDATQTAGRSIYTYRARAADLDDDSLSWSLSTDPDSSASIDESGELSWAVPRTAAGEQFLFTVTVSDGNDAVEQNFQLDVAPFDMQPSEPFFTGAANPPYGATPAFGDIDGDGAADLAVDGGRLSRIGLLLTSRGFLDRLSRSARTTWSSCPVNLAGDMNADQRLDVVVVCNSSRVRRTITIGVWQNRFDQNSHTGQMTASEPLQTSIGADVADATLNDTDGDGTLDVVVATHPPAIRIYTNDGNGRFSSGPAIEPDEPSGTDSDYRIRRIEIDDFDDDPELEVLALETYSPAPTRRDISQLVLYNFRSNGSIDSNRASTLQLDGNPDKMAVGDIDGDGDLDVAVKQGVGGTVATYLNGGSGSFSKGGSISHPRLGNSDSNRAIALGTFDHDEHVDVVVGQSNTGRAFVAFGDGTGNLVDIARLSPSRFDEPFSALRVDDYDGDERTDIYGWSFGDLVVYH